MAQEDWQAVCIRLFWVIYFVKNTPLVINLHRGPFTLLRLGTAIHFYQEMPIKATFPSWPNMKTTNDTSAGTQPLAAVSWCNSMDSCRAVRTGQLICYPKTLSCPRRRHFNLSPLHICYSIIELKQANSYSSFCWVGKTSAFLFFIRTWSWNIKYMMIFKKYRQNWDNTSCSCILRISVISIA